MLEDRNLTLHTYKEDVANEVLKRILKKYISVFENILAQLNEK